MRRNTSKDKELRMGLFYTAQNMIAGLRERKDRNLEAERNSVLNNSAYNERSTVSNFLDTNRTPQLSSGPSSISHAVQAMEEEKTHPSPSFFPMGDTNWGSGSRKQDFKNLLLDVGNQFSTKENPIDPDTLDAYFKKSQPITYMDGQDVVYQGRGSGPQAQISEVLDGTVPSKDAARKIYLQNTVDEAVKTSDESFAAYKLLEESTFSPEEGRYWSVEDFLRLNEDGSTEGTRILGEILYNIVDLGALGFSGVNVDPGMTGLVGSMVIQTPKVQQMFLDITEGLLSVISSEELKGFSVMRAIRTAVDGLTLDKNPPGDKSLNVSRLFEQIHWPWEPLGDMLDSDTVNKLNEELPGLLDQVVEDENSMYNNPAYTRSLTDPYQELAPPSPLTDPSFGPPILGSLGFIAASALGAVDTDELFNRMIKALPEQRAWYEANLEPISQVEYKTVWEYERAQDQRTRYIIQLTKAIGNQIDFIDEQSLPSAPMIDYRENIDEMYMNLIGWLAERNHVSWEVYEPLDGALNSNAWRKTFPKEITDYIKPKDADGNRPKLTVNTPEELIQYVLDQDLDKEKRKRRSQRTGLPGEEKELTRLQYFNHFLREAGKPEFNSWQEVVEHARYLATDPNVEASDENIAFIQKVAEVNAAVNQFYAAESTEIFNLRGAINAFLNPSANSEYLQDFMNGKVYGPPQEKNRSADLLSMGVEAELNKAFKEHYTQLTGDTDDHFLRFISTAEDPGGYNINWHGQSPAGRVAAMRTFFDFEEKYGIELQALGAAKKMYAGGLENLHLLFNIEKFNRDDESRAAGIQAAFLITDLGVLTGNENLSARQAFFDRLGIEDERQILLLALIEELKEAGVLTYSLGMGLIDDPNNLANLIQGVGDAAETITTLMTADEWSVGNIPDAAKDAFKQIRMDLGKIDSLFFSSKPVETIEAYLIASGWQDLNILDENGLWKTHEMMLTSLGLEIATNEEKDFKKLSPAKQKIEILSTISLMMNNPLIDPKTVAVLMQLPMLGGDVEGDKVGLPVTYLARWYGSANLVRDDNKPTVWRRADGGLDVAPKEIVDSLNAAAHPPTADDAEEVGRNLPGHDDIINETITATIRHPDNTPWLSSTYSDFTNDRVGVDTVSNRGWVMRHFGRFGLFRNDKLFDPASDELLGYTSGWHKWAYTEPRPERVVRFLVSHVDTNEVGILNERTGERSLDNVATISGIDVRVSEEERSKGITPLIKLAMEVSRRAKDTETALQRAKVSRRAEAARIAAEKPNLTPIEAVMMGHRYGPGQVRFFPSTEPTDDPIDGRDVRELIMTDVLFTFYHLLEGPVVMKGKGWVGPDSPVREDVEWDTKDGEVHPAGSLVSMSGITFGGNLNELPRPDLPKTIYSEPTDTERPANYIGTYNVDPNPFYYIHDPSNRGSLAILVNTNSGPQLISVDHLNIPLNQINYYHNLHIPSSIVGWGGWRTWLGYNKGMLFDHASNNDTRDYTHQDFSYSRSNLHPAAISSNSSRKWFPPRYSNERLKFSEENLFYKEMSGSESKQIRHYDQTE